MSDERTREENDIDDNWSDSTRRTHLRRRPIFGDGALAFLKRAADGEHRIVCSCDLTTIQIAEARAFNRFYVEPGGGLGWALMPWRFTTLKDANRARATGENER